MSSENNEPPRFPRKDPGIIEPNPQGDNLEITPRRRRKGKLTRVHRITPDTPFSINNPEDKKQKTRPPGDMPLYHGI